MFPISIAVPDELSKARREAAPISAATGTIARPAGTGKPACAADRAARACKPNSLLVAQEAAGGSSPGFGYGGTLDGGRTLALPPRARAATGSAPRLMGTAAPQRTGCQRDRTSTACFSGLGSRSPSAMDPCGRRCWRLLTARDTVSCCPSQTAHGSRFRRATHHLPTGIRPSTRKRPALAASGVTTTMPPSPGSIPVSGRRLAPCVCTTSAPGPRHAATIARAPAVN